MSEFTQLGPGARVLSRRGAFVLFGGIVAAAGLAGCQQPEVGPETYSVADWFAARGKQYFIGHRGAGDVVPEHTLEAYQAALGWGAKALEISVAMTSDGVLICQHDLSYDRTTNLKGRVAAQASSVLVDGRVNIDRLGPRWQGPRRPKIARLDDVLRRIGRQAVLCIEPKDDGAYPGIIRLIDDLQLKDSVIFKLHYTSPRIAMAKEAGYPVFAYIGNAEEVTLDRLQSLAAKLNPSRDVLVLPANQDNGLLADSAVAAAVATGIPVWVFPVHRRWEAEHFFAQGVTGLMASSFGYVSRTVQPVRAAEWESGAIAPGEMTQFPESDASGLQWPEPGVISLAAQRGQAFLTLGQLAPLERAAGPYRVELKIRVDTMPEEDSSNFTLAFGHEDDRYYEHRQGTLDGYHAMLRMDGTLELRSHKAGSPDGSPLAKIVPGPPPVVGEWLPLRLDVGEKRIEWSRLDTGGLLATEQSDYRGDYIHIGRSGVNGKISVRDLRVS